MLVPRLNWPPFVYYRHSDRVSAAAELRGILVVVATQVLKSLNVSYDFGFANSTVPEDWVEELVTRASDIVWYPLSEDIYTSTALTCAYPAIILVPTGLVHKSKIESSAFRFLDPFTAELWIAVIVATFVVAILIFALRSIAACGGEGWQQAFAARLAARITDAVYRAWGAMLGGDDYDWAKLGWPGRILRLGFLLFVLVIISTYTANLAAFFTAPTYKVHGPKDMTELKDARACTVVANGLIDSLSLLSFVSSLLETNNFSTDLEEDFPICHDMLRKGTADVWIDPPTFTRSYYLKNCEDLAHVPAIQLAQIPFGFVLRADDQKLADAVSAALVTFQQLPAWKEMEEEYFQEGRSCPSTQTSDTERVGATHLVGLFVVFGGTLGGSVLLAVLQRLRSGAGTGADSPAELPVSSPPAAGGPSPPPGPPSCGDMSLASPRIEPSEPCFTPGADERQLRGAPPSPGDAVC